MAQDPESSLPSGWSRHYDQSGIWYYLNTNTVPPQVSYEHPSAAEASLTTSQRTLSSSNLPRKTLAQQLYASAITFATTAQPTVNNGRLNESNEFVHYPAPTIQTGNSPQGVHVQSWRVPHPPDTLPPGAGFPTQTSLRGQSSISSFVGSHADGIHTFPAVNVMVPQLAQYSRHVGGSIASSPPLISPKPQLPTKSHIVETSPTSPSNRASMPLANCSPVSLHDSPSTPVQLPPFPQAYLPETTIEPVQVRSKEGSKIPNVLKKKVKGSKSTLQGNNQMSTSVVTPAMPSLAGNSHTHPLSFLQSNFGINATKLQEVMQGKPGADYEAVINALHLHQHQPVVAGSTAFAAVDYQTLIAHLRKLQQLSDFSHQGRIGSTSAHFEASSRPSMQQNEQVNSAKFPGRHQSLTTSALHRNSVQPIASHSHRNSLPGNILSQHAPCYTPSQMETPPIHPLENKSPYNSSALECPEGHSQSTNICHARKPLQNPEEQNHEEHLYLAQEIMKVQQQMSKIINSPEKKLELSRIQISLLQAYQNRLSEESQCLSGSTSQAQQQPQSQVPPGLPPTVESQQTFATPLPGLASGVCSGASTMSVPQKAPVLSQEPYLLPIAPLTIRPRNQQPRPPSDDTRSSILDKSNTTSSSVVATRSPSPPTLSQLNHVCKRPPSSSIATSDTSCNASPVCTNHLSNSVPQIQTFTPTKIIVSNTAQPAPRGPRENPRGLPHPCGSPATLVE